MNITHMNPLDLPKRTRKPRKHGLTAITDLGLTVSGLRELLTEYSDYLDIAKFGIGSAYLTPRLAEKVALYREFKVIPYFGGTLFEKFQQQKKVREYAKYLKSFGVDWVEISNGTIEMSLKERVKLIKSLSGDFKVVAEIGCKDASKIMPPSQWIEELQASLDAGASYVITEGRDSATAGLYRESGEIREGLLTDILHAIDPKRTIFEAPTHKTQMYFIKLVGANVNLGNVQTRDLLVLETQRQGLRYETFFNTKA
jgi:phosphosulfolactate synthase